MQPRTNPAVTDEQPVEEIVELHWMYEPDLARSADGGTAVPAVCGERFLPDEQLAHDITSGRARVRYVDCKTCDIILQLDALMPWTA